MSRILPCTVQSLTYVQSCQSCSSGSQGLPLPAGICLGALCPREFQVLPQNWPQSQKTSRKRQEKREVEEGNVWKNLWVNK